jgi:hypothetical protein
LEFVVRSPLSIAECASRLAGGLEGPVPKHRSKVTEWNVYGTADGDKVEATILGVKVGSDGQARRSLRPELAADLTREKGKTVLRGDIVSRAVGETGGRNGRIGAMIVVGVSGWAILELGTRWPILAFSLLYLAVIGYFWLSDRRLTPWRLEGEAELLSWLEKTIDGKQDPASNAER